MSETEFIKHYIANANQMMWFLGAGTSRTAGMPTATDIIWDLKLKIYCREENQDIKIHDINNENIKNKIQSYMDSKGYPSLWDSEEYSFYFDLYFGADYSAQQKYLSEQLNSDKISLNIGHRAIAALVKMNKTKLIFTTNFDEVIESACAKVGEMTLPTFNLEGSYAALDALNSEMFPIYAKIHGDFKYQKVKNLTEDLLSNDQKIQSCFVSASNRYGIIVTGYSGRDKNVMSMFEQAIELPNAFPFGLIWTVTNLKNVPPVVTDFISKAQSKGIKAYIIETGTFDNMMMKIWRQVPNVNDNLNKKVKTSVAKEVKIKLPEKGSKYPVLRTNALSVTIIPNECAIINTKNPLSSAEIKELVRQNKSRAIISRTELVLGWGEEEEIIKALGEDIIESVTTHAIENPYDLVTNSTLYHSFYERALLIALCDDKPLEFKNNRGFYLTMKHNNVGDPLFQPLKQALAYNGTPGAISGIIPNSNKIAWSEAVNVKLENKNGNLYVMLKPTIWIEPSIERRNYKEFVKSKIRYRYNPKTNELLDAWIKILFGSIGKGETEITCFKGSSFPATFKINTRTAYSRK